MSALPPPQDSSTAREILAAAGMDVSPLAGKRKVAELLDKAAGRPGSSDDGHRALPMPVPHSAPLALGNAAPPSGPPGLMDVRSAIPEPPTGPSGPAVNAIGGREVENENKNP